MALLRLDEGAQVMETFERNLGVRVVHVDASAEFLHELAGVSDPEAKRKIIGREFVVVFQREAGKIADAKCWTDFTATTPEKAVYYNTVEWDAVPTRGGTLCTDGKWRARDGSASGTTPLRVFFKGGVWRRSP